MVTLRPILPEDRERMLDILTSDRVNKTYMLPDFENREDAVPLFHRLMDMCHDEGKYARAIATSDGLIGFLNHTDIQDKQIELGYVIHPDFHGKCYMTKALQLAMKELFSMGYQEVVAGTFSTNAASIRVMVKCGMTRLLKTDQIEYRGNTHTCVYYSRKKAATAEMTFTCCFCGKSASPTDFYALTIRRAHVLDGPVQELFCCESCLEDKLADPKLLYLKYM